MREMMYSLVGNIKKTWGSVSCNTSKMVKIYIRQMILRMIFVKTNVTPKNMINFQKKIADRD